MTLNPEQVKAESEQIILSVGGKTLETLPELTRTRVRPREEIIDRALVMNAMLQLYFEAPVEIIDGWIYENGLEECVSPRESVLLSKPTDQLTHEEKLETYWYIEGLWALMWVGSLIDSLPFDRSVEDFMASLAPNLQLNEDGSKFQNNMRIRLYPEVFKMLDLYYRLHWYANDAYVNGRDTGHIKIAVIMERRRALEWVMQPDVEWDAIQLTI